MQVYMSKILRVYGLWIGGIVGVALVGVTFVLAFNIKEAGKRLEALAVGELAVTTYLASWLAMEYVSNPFMQAYVAGVLQTYGLAIRIGIGSAFAVSFYLSTPKITAMMRYSRWTLAFAASSLVALFSAWLYLQYAHNASLRAYLTQNYPLFLASAVMIALLAAGSLAITRRGVAERIAKRLATVLYQRRAIVLADYFFALTLSLVALWYLTNLDGGLVHDEVRYATTGYYALTKNQLVDLGVSNHPPLIKYFMGLSQVVFGISSFAIRLPSALFALSTLTVVYLIGRQKWSPLVGLSSAILLALTYGFSKRAVLAFLDAGLMFFIVLACLVFIRFRGKDTKYFPILLGIVSGFIFTSKFTGVLALLPIMAFAGYLSYNRRNLRISLSYFLTLLVTVLLIYLPYLPKFDVVAGTMVFTAQHAVRTASKYGFWEGLMLFFTNQGNYNPLYALGVGSAFLHLLFSKDLDKKFLSSVSLTYFIGIHLLQLVTPRFILSSLPFFAILSFGLLHSLLSKIKTERVKLQVSAITEGPATQNHVLNLRLNPKSLAIVMILALILISPYGMLVWSPDPTALPRFKSTDINSDSRADKLAALIANYSQNKTNVMVLSQKHPSLLYYLGADPKTYVTSPSSPSVPLYVFKTVVNVKNSEVTLFWLGFNRDVDSEVLALLKQGKIDIAIIHNPIRLGRTVVGTEILAYIEAHHATLVRFEHSSIRVYFM